MRVTVVQMNPGADKEENIAQARRLIDGAAALIAGCACDAGCPSCTGPRLEPNIDAAPKRAR